MMGMQERHPAWQAAVAGMVEPARVRSGMSLRRAARKAGMSDALWRQLVAGVGTDGNPRWPTKQQTLDMAAAVGVLEPVAAAVGATPAEVGLATARLTGRSADEGESEIMAARHLTMSEKDTLITTLRSMRAAQKNGHHHEPAPNGV